MSGKVRRLKKERSSSGFSDDSSEERLITVTFMQRNNEFLHLTVERLWGGTQPDEGVTVRRRRGYRKTHIGLLMIIIVGEAVAGGLQINEQSATAMSMGGAFVALASNPSAIYFNPAGLSFQKGTKFLLGTTVIVTRPTFRGVFPAVDETRMENSVSFPSYFYVTHTFESGVGLGFGVYNPFGLRTEWPDDWVGRYLTTRAELQTFYLNPSISYKVGTTISIGGGINYLLGSAELQRRVDLSPGEGHVKLEGDGNAVTVNIGFLFRPSACWSFGVSWRRRASLDIDGTGTFSMLPDSLVPEFPGGDLSVVIKLPDNISSGVAYSPNDDWVFSAEFQWIGWSVVDSVNFNFSTTTSLQKDIRIVENWVDGWLLRVGGEYRLSSVWKVRAGYFYDSVPSVDKFLNPILPEADRMGFNVGAGYKVSDNLFIDVSFLYVRSNEREITNSLVEFDPSRPGEFFNGTYNSSASMFALNLGYNL